MSDCNNELICWEPNDIINETPIAKNYVAWGFNTNGQLGNNKTQNITIPDMFKFIGIKQISCGFEHTAILLNNGQVYTCGDNQYGQLGRIQNSGSNPIFEQIDPNVGKVKQISCGQYHTAILLNNGQVYTCGRNNYGQLGRIGNVNTSNPNPIFVQIDKTIIKNIKFFLLSIGCDSNSVLALPY